MSASYDAAAVAALADQPVSWQDKALPPAFWGRTVAEVLAGRPRLSQLPTPLLTLSAPGLRAQRRDPRPLVHRARRRARAARQDHDGARALGDAARSRRLGDHARERLPARRRPRATAYSRVMIANAVISPLQLRWIADELAADPSFEVMVWADSVRTVEIMEAARSAYVGRGRAAARRTGRGRRLRRPDRRAGRRDRAGRRRRDRGRVDAATRRGRRLRRRDRARRRRGRPRARPRVPARPRRRSTTSLRNAVRRRPRPGRQRGRERVLRAGRAGARSARRRRRPGGPPLRRVHRPRRRLLPRHLPARASHPRTDGERLVPAMHGWIRITSQPEPGLGDLRRRASATCPSTRTCPSRSCSGRGRTPPSAAGLSRA